ncbi:MAG TPA: hypothetical protein VII11_02795 [Bacteroidota bacterium]
MTTITPHDEKLKEIFKSAFVEAVQENKEMFSELLAEVLEDIALAEAIREGEKTPFVSKEEVFKALEG